MAVSDEPIVSSDIIGNSHSSIVDLGLTQVVGGNMLKVIAWYDNEYGYANRLVEQVVTVGNRPATPPAANVSNPVASSDQTPVQPQTVAPQPQDSVPQAAPTDSNQTVTPPVMPTATSEV